MNIHLFVLNIFLTSIHLLLNIRYEVTYKFVSGKQVFFIPCSLMTFLSRKASPRFCQLPFRGQRRRFLLQFCLMVFPGQIFLQLKLSSQSPLFFHSFSHVMMSCVFSDLADTFCSNEPICSSEIIFGSNGKIGSN